MMSPIVAPTNDLILAPANDIIVAPVNTPVTAPTIVPIIQAAEVNTNTADQPGLEAAEEALIATFANTDINATMGEDIDMEGEAINGETVDNA